MKPRRLAIIGDRDLAKRAHAGIEASLEIHRRDEAPGFRHEWIGTGRISPAAVGPILADATAVWCAPGSPYASTTGALLAIRHARETGKAFLGTCGGFQHALMEFSRNVLGRRAEHAESAPDATDPLISKLSCSLVNTSGLIRAMPGSGFAARLGGGESTEAYHCNYGLNPALEKIFAGSDLEFVAHDDQGQIRAFQLRHHPFFIGTLFQPERRALAGTLHPLVRVFFQAA